MRDSTSRRVLFLAASAGGHLDLLRRLTPAFADRERVWVTSEGPRADDLRDSGERVLTVPEYGRDAAALAANARAALRIVLRHRPRAILSAGAGVVLPFAVLGRLAGARLVFVETMARVRSATANGRVLSRLAARTIVQWPELLGVYPRARLARPLLLEGLGVPAPAGSGTLVTVGTHGAPFDRLLETADAAVRAGLLPRPARAQTGACRYRPRDLEAEPWLDAGALSSAIADAEVVVTHGGAGAISAAVRAGRRPLVMARAADRGEHVDDHQAEVVDKLDDLGLIRAISGTITPADVAAATSDREAAPAFAGAPLTDLVAAELR
jgi:UDP-N-acetylglucosamine--N-acetylmuramyl-(pentapeptide) pyrophosphoryl-undecaprenol N-acetylglucosamine transferase